MSVSTRSLTTLATLGLIAMTAVWGSTFVLIKDVVGRMPVADFLAVRFEDAGARYQQLLGRGIVVRDQTRGVYGYGA